MQQKYFSCELSDEIWTEVDMFDFEIFFISKSQCCEYSRVYAADARNYYWKTAGRGFL